MTGTKYLGGPRRHRQKPKRERPGFVYVLRYSSGAVKIGRAEDITRRFAQHDGNARVHGVERVAVWFRWFEDSYVGEKRLLNAYRVNVPTADCESEWDAQGNFGAAVNLANRCHWLDGRETKW